MLSRYITSPLAVLALVLATAVSATPKDISKRQASKPLDVCESDKSGGWPLNNPAFKHIQSGITVMKYTWDYNGVIAMFGPHDQTLRLIAGDTSSASTSVAFTVISSLPHSSGTWTYKVKHGQDCIVNVPKSPPNHAVYQVRMMV